MLSVTMVHRISYCALEFFENYIGKEFAPPQKGYLSAPGTWMKNHPMFSSQWLIGSRGIVKNGDVPNPLNFRRIWVFP